MTRKRVAIGIAVAVLVATLLLVIFVVITYYGPVTTQTGTGPG